MHDLAAGTSCCELELGEFVTSIGATDVDGDRKDDIVVYTYPTRGRRGRFRVFSRAQTASPASDWTTSAACSFTLSDTAPARIVTIEDSRYTIRSLNGAVEHSFDVSGAGRFCHARAHPLAGGRWLLVGSGGGGTNDHQIAVVSEEGELLFLENGEGHATAMLMLDAARPEFLIGIETTVWKYTPTR